MGLFDPPSRHGRELTAVVDIGKTNSRLLLLGDSGELVHETSRPSTSQPSGLGYTALDTLGCEQWLRQALRGIGPAATELRHIIVTTHGASVAALSGQSLALPVPDYECDVFSDRSPQLEEELDPFESTLSPVLPRGLNMGIQLDWLSRHAGEQLAKADTFMPYAQYWAWWLSGSKSTEVSSLGCHTLLWQPAQQTYSAWAVRRGWASKFAPLRKAWEALGVIRPELADELGLPRGVRVHVGVHDSNACLARYLRSWPRMTLVSTGTWVVVMTPGALPIALEAGLDQLANVSVRGEPVPTARFMGGREIAQICAGADPALADLQRVADLLRRGLRVTPGFTDQGGPFAGRPGDIRLGGRALSPHEWEQQFEAEDRATAAALYAAQVTAWTIRRLGGLSPVVIEGPLAGNGVFPAVLEALLPEIDVHVSDDAVEGTARGSWCLTRWTEAVVFHPDVQRARCPPDLAAMLKADWDLWLNGVRPCDVQAA